MSSHYILVWTSQAMLGDAPPDVQCAETTVAAPITGVGVLKYESLTTGSAGV